MKKTAIILLLLIVIISQCGYYCLYGYEIYCAKQSAKEEKLQQIPDELLTKINANDNNQIYWEDEGEELRLNGQMYDVVREKVESGNKYLLCIPDEKEDSLFNGLSEVIKINTDANTTGKHQFGVKFQNIDIICTNSNSFFPEKTIAYLPAEFYEYKSALNIAYKKIHFPPPKSIS